MTNPPDTSLPSEAPTSLSQWKDASFEASTFPIYTITNLPIEEIRDISETINQAATDYLHFEAGELEEMGLVAAPGPRWDFSDTASLGEVLDYHASVDYSPEEGSIDSKWCPLAFVAVTTKDWRKEGLLLVGFDFSNGSGIRVSSCQATAKRLGEGLVSLRQGDEPFVETRDYVDMRSEGADR